jgi:ABC-type transport system involved in multi-copper enzyme maturation permease subunit
VIYYLQPGAQGMPFTTLAALLLASICGSLGGVLLSTSVRSELNMKAYDLFLIRPVKRIHLLLAKYFSVIAGLGIAVLLSLAIGVAVDMAKTGTPLPVLIGPNLDSIVTVFSTILIAGSIGLLLGLVINSVPVAAIVSFYVCNQISGLILVSGYLLKLPVDIKLFSALCGLGLGGVIFAAAGIVFSRKQL